MKINLKCAPADTTLSLAGLGVRRIWNGSDDIFISGCMRGYVVRLGFRVALETGSFSHRVLVRFVMYDAFVVAGVLVYCDFSRACFRLCVGVLGCLFSCVSICLRMHVLIFCVV
jgi:hypothetical protein